MKRLEAVRCHPIFQREYGQLWAAEADRQFCRHSMEHLLDVARILYILGLEDGVDLSKEVLYAAALLHDVGRQEQSTAGTPHEVAGARLAGEILRDCGFSETETAAIQQAILSHRKTGAEDWLCRSLYRADKASRACYACPAAADCNWLPEKKNLQIAY